MLAPALGSASGATAHHYPPSQTPTHPPNTHLSQHEDLVGSLCGRAEGVGRRGGGGGEDLEINGKAKPGSGID